MKTYKLVAILLLSCVLTSCKTTAILTETFESEVIGGLPVMNIPGAPSGDQIIYEPPLSPRIKVTTSTNSSGQKALTFSQAVASGLNEHNQFLSFRGISSDFTQPLWFYYTATMLGSGSDLMMEIADGSAGLIARMYISNTGDVTLVRSLSGTSDLIGNIALGTIHTVIVALDMNKKTYNLSIIKTGGNIAVKDRPVLIDNPLAYANPAHSQISFRFDASTFETRKYVIESVNINRKQP